MPVPKAYERADGRTTWRVRFRHGTKNTSETFATQAEALAFCSDITHHGSDHALRVLEDADWLRGIPTLDEAFEEFATAKARRVRSDRTVADYRRDYRLWIGPRLGPRPIGAISQRDVQDWVEWMENPPGRKALAPKTIAHRHALLHSIIQWAMHPSRAWVQADPCAATDLPLRRKSPPKGLRLAEWVALHRALTQIDPDAADLAHFLFSTGFRWSEATGMSTWDVDPGTPTFVTMGRVLRRNAAGQNVVVEDAKSAAGQRRIKLSPGCATMVLARMDRATPGGLLFTTRNGAAWNYAHFRERAWNRAVEVANLTNKPTPHWLRHTHVAMLATQGVPLAELQARIGHANISTTIGVYGRMITDVSATALADLDAMVAAAETGHPAVAAAPAAQTALPPMPPDPR